MTLFGVGPIIACHLLAEIGSGLRFRRARQLVRLSGLAPIVNESGLRRRRGQLAKQAPPAALGRGGGSSAPPPAQ